MLIRKLITIIKLIELYFRGVKIKKTLRSNIDMSVKVYNKGKDLKIGERIYIRSNVSINTEDKGSLILGNKVFINRNSIISCREKIIIKDNCIIGPNVCIYDHDHKFGSNGVEDGYISEEVIIEENCWIGAGAIILKGSHIGKNSIIAAGTIVKGKYPSNSMVYNKRECIVKELISKNKETIKEGEKTVNG